MKIQDILNMAEIKIVAGEKGLDREVTDGYCGDLLSDVMANCNSGSVWMTIQGHQNIVAVGVLKDVSAIILVNGHNPEDDTVAKANEEGLPVLVTPLTSFSLAGALFKAGVGQKT